MNLVSLLTASLAIFAATGRLDAGIITVADFSGSETLIDFGNPASSVVFGSPTTINGVTFTTNAGTLFVQEPAGAFSSLFANVPGASLQGTLRDATGTSDFVVSFSSPVNRTGLLLSAGTNANPATWTVTAFSGATSLGSVTVSQPTANRGVFAGLEFSQNIDTSR
jgi:hypothetical protein